MIIRNNEGSSGGGFACMYNSFPILENVSIINNSATDLGGGIWCWDSYPELTNVTIVNNTALQSGAIHVAPPYEYNSGYIYSHVRLTNSIVWNNSVINDHYKETNCQGKNIYKKSSYTCLKIRAFIFKCIFPKPMINQNTVSVF